MPYCSSEGLLTDWWGSAEPRKWPYVMFLLQNRCHWTSGIVKGPFCFHHWTSTPSSICIHPCLIPSSCSKGVRGFSSSLRPSVQIRIPPFPCIIFFLFCVFVLSLTANTISILHVKKKENHSLNFLLPSFYLFGLCSPLQPSFLRKWSPHPVLLKWGWGHLFCSLWPHWGSCNNPLPQVLYPIIPVFFKMN